MSELRFDYKPLPYKLEVLLEGIVGLIALPVCLIAAYINLFNMSGLFIVFAVAAAYLCHNTFIAKCYVKSVIYSEEQNVINFESMGKETAIDLNSIKEFKVREYPSSGKMYIRVEGHNILRGRYWINSSSFTNGRQLFDLIRNIEYQIHPESLKAKARRTNEKYVSAYGYGRKKKKSKLFK